MAFQDSWRNLSIKNLAHTLSRPGREVKVMDAGRVVGAETFLMALSDKIARQRDAPTMYKLRNSNSFFVFFYIIFFMVDI